MTRRLATTCTLVLALFLPSAAAAGDTPAQTQELAWVLFRDKNVDNLEGALAEAEATLSARSRDRRARRAAPGYARIREADLPVHEPYIQAIQDLGVEIRQRTRWMNGVSVAFPAHKKDEIAALPFVREVRPLLTARWTGPRKAADLDRDSNPGRELPYAPQSHGTEIDYGDSFDQLAQIDIPPLHEAGYTGAGILVAMFDTGFRKSHDALDDANVVAERDFVFGDGDTEDEPEDEDGAMWHGTACWSIVGGWEPGTLIGGAYGADFVLAKTEDIRSEQRVEEDNWVAAVEWADSLGVDVISSSLGYLDFDDGFQYEPEELDGRTAVTTLAAVHAQRVGIVVCTAAGNSGDQPSTIVTPGDADSILTVGGVDPWNQILEFSSRGPTADDRIKPDICARGSEAVSADSDRRNGFIDWFAGTSAATPFVAAGTALILEARPAWTVMDVVNAFKQSASHGGNPNNDYGWGVISVLDATVNPGVEDDKGGDVPGHRGFRITQVAPNPFNPQTTIRFELDTQAGVRVDIMDPRGALVRRLVDETRPAGLHATQWDGRNDAGHAVTSGTYLVRVATAAGSRTQRIVLLK